VSLSDTRVISTLNRYFVPVYLANEDYRDGGTAPAEERAELQRIHKEGYAQKLSVGTVHAYVLAPDGHLIDSLHVVDAAKSDSLLAMLERAVEKLGTQPGEPLVKPSPVPAPAAETGGLVLHLTARYLERKGDTLTVVDSSSGDWSALPGEDWIVLGREQVAKLLPPGKPSTGTAWTIDPALSATLLTHFYPPTENNDLAKNRLEEQTLTGVVESVQGGVARARVEGRLKMGHPFYHKEDGRAVEAAVVGYVDFEPAPRKVRALRLVTDQAVYRNGAGGQPYGVVVRSL
jgi:hypothetical protein